MKFKPILKTDDIHGGHPICPSRDGMRPTVARVPVPIPRRPLKFRSPSCFVPRRTWDIGPHSFRSRPLVQRWSWSLYRTYCIMSFFLKKGSQKSDHQRERSLKWPWIICPPKNWSPYLILLPKFAFCCLPSVFSWLFIWFSRRFINVLLNSFIFHNSIFWNWFLARDFWPFF